MTGIHELLINAATVFMGLFAIMNPLANTPVFLGLTANDDANTRKTIARRAMFLAFVLVTLFCLFGKMIFEMFGISLPAFRITGGILVFLIGYHMLQGAPSAMHHPSDGDQARSLEVELSVAVSPLAMPILAGPGTIATAMNFSSGEGVLPIATTVLAFALLCIITYYFFIYGQKLITYIGDSAVNVVTRMMGLILAVIGIQMLVDGIIGAFHLSQT